MYPFMTLADETLITHSHVFDENGLRVVEVHFERPVDGGFDTARCSLPSYEWIIRDGFADEEITEFERMLHEGAHVFFKFAEQGGAKVAKAI